MGVGISAEQPAKEWADPAQMLEINPTPDSVVGLSKIQHHQSAARRQDTRQLRKTPVEISKISQAIADGDQIKGSGFEGQSQRIALLEPDPRRSLGGQAHLSAPRDFQHARTEIQAHRLCAPTGEGEGHVARATTDIQREVPRPWGGEVQQAALPVPMQAKALEVINAIIVRRHGGEEILHSGRPFRSGNVEFAGHGGALGA